MSRLGREEQRDHEGAEHSPDPATTPIDVRVPEGSGVRSASVDGALVVAAPGEEIQNAVLNRLHRLALAAGHPVLATIRDERLGYSVPLRVDPDGSSHLASEPVPTAPEEKAARQDRSAHVLRSVEPVRDSAPTIRRPAEPEPQRSPATASVPVFPLRAPAGPAGGTAPGTVAPPTGEFGPPPRMDGGSETGAQAGPPVGPQAGPWTGVPAGTCVGHDTGPQAGPRTGPQAAAETVTGTGTGTGTVEGARPRPASEPVATPEPVVGADPLRRPEPVTRRQAAIDRPEPVAWPEPITASEPAPARGPRPVTATASEPAPARGPRPVTATATASESAPARGPRPVTATATASESAPARGPRPVTDAPPEPAHAPQSFGAPAPFRRPEPAPLPKSLPAPAPTSVPAPAPLVDLGLARTVGPGSDPKPTPVRGFDAVAEAVLGDGPLTAPGDATTPALLAEPTARINEAVKEGCTEKAALLAEQTVTEASEALGPEHPEVLRLRELSAYIAYLSGDPDRAFLLSLDLARTHRRAGDAEAAYGNVQSAATAWRAVRDPARGLELGRDLVGLWGDLAAEEGPAAGDTEQLESARTRMGRLTERARARAGTG
ncbi:tetratricopeptide repeat protein [Streptomyces ziwulingensis]